MYNSCSSSYAAHLSSFYYNPKPFIASTTHTYLLVHLTAHDDSNTCTYNYLTWTLVPRAPLRRPQVVSLNAASPCSAHPTVWLRNQEMAYQDQWEAFRGSHSTFNPCYCTHFTCLSRLGAIIVVLCELLFFTNIEVAHKLAPSQPQHFPPLVGLLENWMSQSVTQCRLFFILDTNPRHHHLCLYTLVWKMYLGQLLYWYMAQLAVRA